ncbi:hypothetical protein A11A3_02442 [Alcanivorax hongdengensis A-11-3]|uniref:Uncharacterized protein n=1 Tax=Alcanivorax hongdengensis A-11-3 TaxID=1177179 RepID=L0WF79_9GAMM|nr:hypothetical protein [Alcanivorax hongdengensis]EKF75691.1 hypothetical protein A11A3_02442 [Alcanivorax hongdengensis A-11-3]
MKLFKEKSSDAKFDYDAVLISESSDVERLKRIARNTAFFDLDLGETRWEEGCPEQHCLRMQLSHDYCFVIRP